MHTEAETEMDYSGEKCAVCSEPSVNTCENCCKVYYCSDSHQISHMAGHEIDCFPAIVAQDDVNGRYLVASRTIEEGALIMRERALVAGPSRAENEISVCLGCHKALEDGQGLSCSKCSWPICSTACERNKWSSHSKEECDIFSRNSVPPVMKPHEYDFIKFLRTLLLSETNPTIWSKICQLESHCSARSSIPKEVNISIATARFLHDKCSLNQFDFETINFVVGANRVNSFSGNIELENGTRNVSLLFYNVSLLNHSCVPNIRSFIVEKSGGYWMELRAAVRIEKGTPLTQQYISITNGTQVRRRALEEGYYFSCTCQRCCDPTELSTQLSSVKCPDCSDHGNLTPIDSLDPDTNWKCGECDSVFDNDYIQSIVEQVEDNIKLISSSDDSPVEDIDALITIVEEARDQVLHKNHYLLMNLQYEIVQRFIYIQEEFLWSQHRIEKMVSYIQHCLDLANIFRPGVNNYRGGLLYYLARCYYLLLNIGSSKEKHAMTDKMQKCIKESYSILISEPKHSQRSEMAMQLQQFLK